MKDQRPAQIVGMAITCTLMLSVSAAGQTTDKPLKLKFPAHSGSVKILRPNAPAVVNPAGRDVLLKRGELIARKLPAPAPHDTTQAATQGAVALPYEIKGLDAQGEEVDLHPDVEIRGGGMRPAGPTGPYRGTVDLAVHDERRHGSHPLTPPIALELTGDAEMITPNRIELQSTNTFKTVTLEARDPQGPLKLKVTPTFDEEGTEVQIAVLPGRLLLNVSPVEIQGLGLETATVTVQSPDLKGAIVTLDSPIGRLDETSMQLDENGVAKTTLRSVSIGAATLSASGALLAPIEKQVRFLIPWVFLTASALGGMLGAMVKRRLGSAGRRSGPLGDVTSGVCAGLLAAAAFAVGINLVGFHPTARAGEALVFVLSALGAIALPSLSRSRGTKVTVLGQSAPDAP